MTVTQTGSLREYGEALTSLGMSGIFAPHILKMWGAGIPAEYVVAALKATGKVSTVIEMWQADIPLEYAGAR